MTSPSPRLTLDAWVVREDGAVVGHGGCAVRGGTFWNLGYRFAPEAQGRGLATRVARAAVDAGNPDPTAIRLVMADRELSEQELAATLR